MEWVPLSGYETGINLNDRPRKLTEQEIQYVTDHFPTAPSADPEAAEVNRKAIVHWMSEELRNVSICPSAIPDLINRIVDQHNKSLVAPGTPVGITASEAVGASATQMTLNSVAPWEEIFVQDAQGQGHLLKIGDWIDSLLQNYPDRIQHIPKNRTQYLELSSPVSISTCDENGKVSWEQVTAVTKHLPVGDLIKVITRSGREVTVTQSKSLLIWDGSKLVATKGSKAKVGDKVPIMKRIPDPPIISESFDNVILTAETGRKLANHITGDKLDDTFINWISEGGDLMPGLLLGPKTFITELMNVVSLRNNILNKNCVDYLISRSNDNISDIIDVMLDPIVKIEYVKGVEYVYDLTVPITTNFSLWNSLVAADTFHFSGQAKSASFGIEAMKDLIFAKKTPKNESCTIYFNNKRATYEEVLSSRYYIVGSVVKNFIRDYDIDLPDRLTPQARYWWHDQTALLLDKEIPTSTYVLRLYLDVPEMYKHHVTIKELAKVLEREIPPSVVAVHGPISDGIIDIYPNPNFFRETLKQRVKTLVPEGLAELKFLEDIVWPELENIRVKGISGIKNLTPIISPVWRMVLLERKIKPEDVTNENPQLEQYRANGTGWLLFYNSSIMKITGLTAENLSALCREAGIERIGGNNAYLAISMPNDRFKTARGDMVIELPDGKYRNIPITSLVDRDGVLFQEIDPKHLIQPLSWQYEIDDGVFVDLSFDDIWRVNDKVYIRVQNPIVIINENYYERITDNRVKINEIKPGEYIMTKVNNAKRFRRDEIKRLTDLNIEASKKIDDPVKQKQSLRKLVDVPRSTLVIASEFVYAETEGSNLKELLSLPGIDKQRTTCNNMYTIAETLGIEATRTFLIKALYDTISNTGSYVHPANITFIAEFITNRGEPFGATYSGISRQAPGHLSLATLEQAGKVFIQNAVHGRKENISNVSASVAVGARASIGTGYFDIAQNIIENGVPKTIINDDLFTALDRDDNTNLLRAQQAQPFVDDNNQELEDLKGISLGTTFDFYGSEREINQITTHNQGETILDIHTSRSGQVGIPRKMVKRAPKVQPSKVDVGSDFMDILALIQTGVPIEQAPEPVIVQEEAPTTPIISTGLVSLENVLPHTLMSGIPSDLDALLSEYTQAVGGPTIPDVLTITQDLPSEEIEPLPDLVGIDWDRVARELAEVQSAGLNMDVNLLNTTLNS